MYYLSSDSAFSSPLATGASNTTSSEIAAKVLFGMVVRERRRIASLAKTASALDEKLQEIQMDNEAKEVAFRSYVQDSQQDLACISMNHQEQILSLMSLVKEEGDPKARNKTNMMANSTNDPLGWELNESSNLLVLANERIAVLEQQLGELKAEMKVSETYRQEKEEAEAALEAKIEEYGKLEVRLAGQRATLRQIRDLLTKEKKDDEDAPGLDDDDGDRVYRTCLAIIREALRESPGIMSPMARRHSCPNVFQVGALSPRSHKQWELVQSADDEEDMEEEETPEWADEIMADLAFIAEGLVPPSLLDAPEFVDTKDEEEEGGEPVFECLADTGSFTGSQQGGIAVTSVADRDQTTVGPVVLGADEKQFDTHNPTLTPVRTGSRSRSPAGDGIGGLSRSNNRSEKNEPTSPPSIVRPRIAGKENPVKAKHLGGGKHATVAATVIADDVAASASISRKSEDFSKPFSSTDMEATSVFERLVDPTHFTGTQKEKHNAQVAGSQKERQESAAERMLDHLLQSDSDHQKPRQEKSEASHTSHIKVSEYTQQNVFERLQKTTTHSFAVKHVVDQAQEQNASLPQPATGQQKNDATKGKKVAAELKPKRSSAPVAASAESSIPRYKSPSRSNLRQRTNSFNFKTKSSPSKIPSPSRSKTPVRDRSPTRPKTPTRARNEGYTQQNVFERLTKTTTEAYAVKKRVVKN